MASVVFLRGVNVGGRKAFRPKALATDLAHLEVTNVGAAGTFIVRRAVPQTKLRNEILGRLPFDAEIMICRGRDVLDLLAQDPFASHDSGALRRFVSVLGKSPTGSLDVPAERPAGSGWQVKVVAIVGRFALSLFRRSERTMVYPNEVVEKLFGVPATTRTWKTICTIGELLAGD